MVIPLLRLLSEQVLSRSLLHIIYLGRNHRSCLSVVIVACNRQLGALLVSHLLNHNLKEWMRSRHIIKDIVDV